MRTKAVCGWSLMASVASKLVGLNRRVMEIRHPPNLLYSPPPSHSEDWYITWHTAAIINDSPVKRFHKNIFRYLSICYFPFSHLVLQQIKKIKPVLRIIRIEICQKIYTTQFSGKRILHTETASFEAFLSAINSENASLSVIWPSFG